MSDGNGWLKVHLDGISTQLGSMDEKLDKFITETCPAKHGVIDKRIVGLETEVSNRKAVTRAFYVIAGFLGGFVMWIGDKIWNLINP